MVMDPYAKAQHVPAEVWRSPACRARRRRNWRHDSLRTSLVPQNQYSTISRACHSLSLAIKVETGQSLTTQGEPTNPVGRVFPRRIIPWHAFPTHQEDTWSLLVDQPFCDVAAFPSSYQLDYVATLISPIASETELRHFARDTVEIAVQKLVGAAHADDQLRAGLGIQGSVTFESHTNPADQFCIYRRSDGRNVPALAVEYKAPHKLTRDQVVTGLQGEIRPERDVINKDGEGFAFASTWLLAAVITQLFAYMVDKGVQYGYVYTGETFIFLRIPQDPTIVYYSVCVPNLDVMDDDDDRLHRTAVAQVFAFVLQALRSPPPPQAWHDGAAGLDTWAVEFEDALRAIPETKAQHWRNFVCSPIKTRSRCPQGSSDPRPGQKSVSNDDKDDPPSPSAPRSLRPSTRRPAPTKTATASTQQGGHSRGRGGKPGRPKEEGAQMSVRDRPFCTQRCLMGLASGGAMDDGCPNYDDHRQRRHIQPSQFLRLIRDQLANDRGMDADAMPLYLSGSVGAIFKVRLSSYGYTLVAKGVEEDHFARLRYEHEVYNQLRSIQGEYIPVCHGKVDLVLPYYYNGGVFEHFLFLGWAGTPLFGMTRGTAKDTLINTISKAFQAIHKLNILHRDAEPRNLLYNALNDNVMVVDFERAELTSRKPLGVIPGKRNRDEFAEELSSIVSSVQRCIK
ncbi:hypothetical protein F5Y03DRAFT_380867 [Xylaria venustula]|nr:hypothetical protein F5Y03DRAFT_380867 [Xylaria venustula]